MLARLFAVTLLLGLLVAPALLREAPPSAPAGAKRLTIITPHGEHIRREFTQAFTTWALRERGLAVEIDWRTPGGTSEIIQYLRERYRYAALAGLGGDREILRYFDETKPPADATPAQLAARAAFLASDLSCDVDVFFGGGENPYRQLAGRGLLVDAGIQASEPDWFNDAVIPETLAGETLYDTKGRYYSACLSVFGIAWNPDRLRDLAITEAPSQWSDLAQPAYRGQVTLTDPTKSGAAVACFERLLQQAMAEAETAGRGHAAGWDDGLIRIRRLFANCRAITDSASKPARDVVRGDCAAAMALDFQAKFEGESARRDGADHDRLCFVAPLGGTSASSDPIALLRGAPERELAVDFIHFVLSKDGQRLWNYRVGTPGGPVRYALRRLPMRRDVLDADWQLYAADPEVDPFALGATFTYRREWTGPLYPLIGPLCKATCLDVRDDLQRAWRAICLAGGPQSVPEAYAAFSRLPFTYAEAPAQVAILTGDARAAVPRLRLWSEHALASYQLATALAEAGR